MTHGGRTSGEEKGGVLEKGLRCGEVRHGHGLNLKRQLPTCGLESAKFYFTFYGQIVSVKSNFSWFRLSDFDLSKN